MEGETPRWEVITGLYRGFNDMLTEAVDTVNPQISILELEFLLTMIKMKINNMVSNMIADYVTESRSNETLPYS